MQYHYYLYGMRVTADLDFVQLDPVRLPEDDRDFGLEKVRIRAMDEEEEAQVRKEHGDCVCGSFLGTEKGWLCNRTLAMSVERGQVIRYHIRKGGDPGAVRTYLLGFGIAMLSLQQGKLPIHCSALATPEGGAILIAGESGAGKSTLMNHLIGQKIAITSNKPQTTRNRIQTVYTGPKGQIVFLDTPGIHKAKNKLGNYMVKVAESTFSDVDVILWLVEPTTYIGAGERHILEQLKRSRLPVILVINKIDTVPKTAVLDAMETYRKEMDFAEIVPVSALRSNNTDTLLDCIFKYLPYGEPFYDEDTITDQPQRQIVAEMIREKALRCLEEEIPHGIAVAVERMEFKEHIVNIDATIICERDSHKGIIIGKQGSMLKKIGSQARRDIEDMLECQVNLQLWVKVKKDWRDSDFLLKNFGYNPADTRPDR